MKNPLEADALLEDFLDHVCAPLVGIVPFGERFTLRREMGAHLDALVAEFEFQGFAACDAVQNALREMGEPWEVGQAWLTQWSVGRQASLSSSRWARAALTRPFAFFGVAAMLNLLLLEQCALTPGGSSLLPFVVLLAAVSPVICGACVGVSQPGFSDARHRRHARAARFGRGGDGRADAAAVGGPALCRLRVVRVDTARPAVRIAVPPPSSAPTNAAASCARLPNERNPSCEKAFTLIELLVVTAILGLLMALLFPVFARVRATARRANCASNQRQLGAAFLMYAHDYDERLPVQQADDKAGADNRNVVTTSWELKLRPYTKNAAIAVCPDDTQSVAYKDPKSGVVIFSSFGVPSNVAGRPLSEIPASALSVLFLETHMLGRADDFFGAMVGQLGKRSFTPDLGVVSELPDFRHNGTGNYLFVDGHVQTLRGPNPTFPGYKTDSNSVALCGVSDPLPR